MITYVTPQFPQQIDESCSESTHICCKQFLVNTQSIDIINGLIASTIDAVKLEKPNGVNEEDGKSKIFAMRKLY